MAPRIKNVVLSLGLAALAVSCGRPSSISKESMLDSKPDNPVHTIVMPHYEPVFPPGPGRNASVTACAVCPSPRSTTMQPRLSRSTWLSEVHKMRDAYRAQISDEQTLKITDYTDSIN